IWSEEREVIWRATEKLNMCVYGVFTVWSRPQLMAKAVLLGVVGKPPVGAGPNKQPASFKLAHGAGRQDWPEDAGVRQVKRGALAAVTEPAEFPSRVERPKEPFWSKLFTTATPKWSYTML